MYMENTAVAFSRVRLHYQTPAGETAALEDISFTIAPGEFVVFVGPSGCGKTTILSLIAGLLTPSAGSCFLFGNNGANARVGYMLQHDLLLPWLTVWENIVLGVKIQQKDIRESEALARRLLAQYGLAGFENSFPAALSGGMRQRAALIRTLACQPDILLLDEPFSALDYQTRITVSDDISQIIRRQQTTAVMVTHDISEAISLADRVIVLSRRPARIKREYAVELPLVSVIKRRQLPAFSALFNAIWGELDIDEKNS